MKKLKETVYLDTVIATEIMGWKWLRAKPNKWFTDYQMGRDSLLAWCLSQNAAFLCSPEQLVNLDQNLVEVTDGAGMTVLSTDFIGKPGVHKDWGKPMPYSSNMFYAWQVVDTMRENDYRILLDSRLSVYRTRFFIYKTQNYVNKVMEEWNNDTDIKQTAATLTAEGSICLAALKAIEFNPSIIEKLELEETIATDINYNDQ